VVIYRALGWLGGLVLEASLYLRNIIQAGYISLDGCICKSVVWALLVGSFTLSGLLCGIFEKI